MTKLRAAIIAGSTLPFGLCGGCSRPEAPPASPDTRAQLPPLSRATPAPAPPVAAERGPCHGGDLELDRIAQSCMVQTEVRPSPPAASLSVELLPASISVRTADEVTLSVKMTNVTNAPMELDVTLGCFAFEANAYEPGKDQPANAEVSDDCGGLGLCGTGGPVRVTLEPHGSLSKNVVFTASVNRLEPEGDECAWRPVRGLRPGRYVVRVKLPFHDPVPGKPHESASRTVEGSVVVAP